MTGAQAARAVGVTEATLRRWVADGVIPQFTGSWTVAAVGQARLVQRMRERGHSLAAIRAATADGRLAFGPLAELFGAPTTQVSVADAAAEVGIAPELVRRMLAVIGSREPESLSADELELLRYVAAVRATGMPTEAILQLARVYAQAVARIAEAEVRLVHLYVHEPMMRSGGAVREIEDELLLLAGEALPFASPLLDRLHQRMLAQYIEQDIVGHMEAELPDAAADAGRMQVAIAFADLAGYTRLTEEAGDDAAFDVVERFVDSVAVTLPDDARIVKTIGDEVMISGSDVARLAAWAVGFQQLHASDPLPRIAVHHGSVLYRDGDYYGGAVNLAARVAARSAAGEVLVTRPVVDAAAGELAFDRLAEVRLKGFTELTELFVAHPLPAP